MAADPSNEPLPPLILVLGSLNMDLVSYVPHHPEPGETMQSSHFSVSPGGKGANQAVACAKLSRPKPPPNHAAATAGRGVTARVRMQGAVGADPYGAQLLSNLSRHGVDASAVRQESAVDTGLAIIIVDEPTGQNRIVLSPGANHSPSPSASHSLFTEDPALLIMQLEIPLAAVVSALQAARARHIPTLLNPAPAIPSLPQSAYQDLAHLIVNETEAMILSGASPEDLETEAGLRGVGRRFLDRGVRNVVITLGGSGVFYASAGGEAGLVPAEKADVVDTTAAGDTFVGQYALEVVSGHFNIADAVRKANRAAAKTVERRGAQDSIPWRDEIDL
ncbi:Ribokinase-like protein [Hypoxylon sp. NC1633]|nr:Ribokinase-like protein [Hypoxylon sp. NC1633]